MLSTSTPRNQICSKSLLNTVTLSKSRRVGDSCPFYYTRCAWAGGTRESSVSCYFLSYSHLCNLFRRISDSRFTSIQESVGLVLFSAEYLICRHVRTDSRTDWGINIRDGLGMPTYGSSRFKKYVVGLVVTYSSVSPSGFFLRIVVSFSLLFKKMRHISPKA
jgi:hypothetical protein